MSSTRCSASWCTRGKIDDPFADALEALRAGDGEEVVHHVESLPSLARSALAETVASHAANLRSQVPRFAPGWMPRTDDRVATPLAGGRVVLYGVFDLIVGLPQRGTASLCTLGLATGGPGPGTGARSYLALLRPFAAAPAVPPRAARVDDGSLRHRDVREEHLRAIASPIATWLTHRAATDE